MNGHALEKNDERLPQWFSKALLGAAAAVGLALSIYAVSGVSDLQGDKKAGDEKARTFEKRLDRFEDTLQRISDAVGAKKP